jgi:two-component system, LuxR family, response regulator FixJ
MCAARTSKSSLMPIFIVEDDIEVRNSAEFMLESEGYPVLTFERGEELLAALPSLKPCCIIIDYMLPDMTGLDVSKRLSDRGVTIPTIIITGHPSTAIREKVAQAGLPLVEKPLAEDLLKAIERIDPLQ